MTGYCSRTPPEQSGVCRVMLSRNPEENKIENHSAKPSSFSSVWKGVCQLQSVCDFSLYKVPLMAQTTPTSNASQQLLFVRC